MGMCLGTRCVRIPRLSSCAYLGLILTLASCLCGICGTGRIATLSFSLAYTGNESHALVEYAPFQKVPTEKKKIDARNNTIDKGRWDRFVLIMVDCTFNLPLWTDEDYVSFLEMLKGGAETELVSLEALSKWTIRRVLHHTDAVFLSAIVAASQPPPSPTTTPLLEALQAEKSAQKDKKTILRNHTHYKDPAASGSSSKKEDAKKKAAVAAAGGGSLAQATKPQSPAPTSKKAKRAAAAADVAAQMASSQEGLGQGSGSGK